MASRRVRGESPLPAPRAPLSRPRIVETALMLADHEGLASVSVRRIAAELGVTPMAIYNHFESKQAILEGILDHVVSDYAPTDHDTTDAAQWLIETFSVMRRAVGRHPSLVPLLDAWLTAGPGSISMDLMEAILEVLVGMGLDPDAAVRGFYALMCFTVGWCAMEAATRVHRESPEGAMDGLLRYQHQFASVSMERYPTIIRLAPALARSFDVSSYDAEIGRLVRSLSAEV